MQNPKGLQHIELKAKLLNLIDSDRYRTGDKILPEVELSKELSVSRAALRKVLDELQNEGYIRRAQGSGTVLLKKRTKYNITLSSFGSAAETISGYTVLSTDFFKINEIIAGEKYARLLEVEPDDRLLDLERIRSLDGTPAFYTHNVLVKSRIDYHENLYAEIANSLSMTMGWHVEECEASIHFCTADEDLAQKLNVPPGATLLRVEEIARRKDGLPLDYSLDYFFADMFVFKITRRKK